MQQRQFQKPAGEPYNRDLSMKDMRIQPSTRGLLLGLTETGKSTGARILIDDWRNRPERTFTLIADTKPRFRAERELDGRPTSMSGRYRHDDWGDEVIPGSIVIPLNDPASEIRMAKQLRCNCVIAQIPKRNVANIMKVSHAIEAAYDTRRRGEFLLVYCDELNNFFRNMPRAAADPIVQLITSGAERHSAFLGAAQRPSWISIEAMESMTYLMWFKSTYAEDIKKLRSMDIPSNAKPADEYYQFYFFNRKTRRHGMAQFTVRKQNGYRGQPGRTAR